MEDVLEYLKQNSFLPIGEKNPKIKQVKGLISNTKPNPKKLFVAEGLWVFKKLIEFNVEVLTVFASPEAIFTAEAFSALKSVSAKVDKSERFEISLKTFEKISERDKPDGLLAIAALPKFDLSDFKVDSKSVILVLDGIEIPGNIGTMLRMSDGAGLDGVFICNKKARMSHPKLIKGSMGAVLTVPIFEFDSVEACHTWLKEHNVTIYLADTRAPHYYYDEPFGSAAALVMGSERYGITRQWYDFEHVMISIPMLGKCDSLNVGVAATVLAYEAVKKNKLK